MGRLTLLGAGYQPSTGGGAVNLLSQPDALTTSPWTTQDISGYSGGILSNVSATSNCGYVRQTNGSLTDGAQYTFSVDAKPDTGGGWVYLYFRNKAAGNVNAYYNLNTGVMGTITGSPVATSITDIGGGYYRCSITHNASSGGTTPFIQIQLAPADATTTKTNPSSLSIYAANAQLVAG